MGDFNSNSIWDRLHGNCNHSKVVEQLKEKGIVSAYHYLTKEKQGEETTPTFYLYKHKDKTYHIDYCFLNPKNLKRFLILEGENWLQYSDHNPIEVLIDV